MSIAILKFFSIDRKVEDRGFALFFEDGTDKVKTEDTFKPLYIYPIFKKYKVENNLKGGLDLIPSPSPSMKIQIMVGKICLRCKGKTMPFYFQKFVDNTYPCFAFTPQLKFPAQNLNFQ